MDSFGFKEFFLVGLLDSGKPFSLYLAKIILALLTGGACNFGAGFITGGSILVFMLMKIHRNR